MKHIQGIRYSYLIDGGIFHGLSAFRKTNPAQTFEFSGNYKDWNDGGWSAKWGKFCAGQKPEFKTIVAVSHEFS